MKQAFSHPWPGDERAAVMMQAQLATSVERADRLGPVRTVAGVDVAYDKHSDKLIAAVVVLDAATLAVVAQESAQDEGKFPYVPGLFSFRELPAIALALEKLDITPDLIVCDGQGIAHPRRFGLASHLGLLFDVPTIGCGKTRLLGEEDPLERRRGNVAPLRDDGDIIGSAVCTQDGINQCKCRSGTAFRWRRRANGSCAWRRTIVCRKPRAGPISWLKKSSAAWRVSGQSRPALPIGLRPPMVILLIQVGRVARQRLQVSAERLCYFNCSSNLSAKPH